MTTTPTLYVLVGEPGVGKSTVARELADEYNAAHYDSDNIRKTHVVPKMGREEPQYDHEESAKTYSTLYQRARETLADGRPVVLDATFNLEYGRDNAADVADEMDVPVQFVRVTCDDAVTRRRIRERADEGQSVSDADIDVYEKIKDEFEPLDRPHAVIDNSATLEETRRQIRDIHQ